MRLTRSSLFAPAVIFAAVGLAIAGTIVFLTPLRYASTATMRIRAADTSPLDSVLPGLVKAQLSTTDIAPSRIRVHRIDGSNSVFQISVIESDPGKSQELTRLLTQELVAAKYQWRGGIELVDVPNYQGDPINPNRFGIASMGLIAGGLCGMLFGLFRSRRSLVQV